MGKKILVADDALFMRIIIKKILKSAGYEVLGEATNGKEAYYKYLELRPDLVLMDLTMPEYDGLEGISMIMKSDPNAKILVCSAMGQKHMVIEAFQLGAKDFLVKPLKEAYVIRSIKKLIG